MRASAAIRVPSFAKINLTLKVLGKRVDGFHELRTVFQTISIKDSIEIRYSKAAATSITVDCQPDISNNIAARAAALVLEHLGVSASVHLVIRKLIPMGGGLGGGSSNAAAVLLGLPVLARRKLPLDEMVRLAAGLGSDVPFFLCGGTALGLGRGEEVYPFPEPKASQGLLVLPDIHVSTPGAYRALGRGQLTVTEDSRIINKFQALGWEIGEGLPIVSWRGFCQNDFEEVVFDQFPRILRLKKVLDRSGARVARMTGSGSTLFGFFDTKAEAGQARLSFPKTRTVPFRTVSRALYRAEWWKSLGEHVRDTTWPPQSWYAK